MRRPLAVIAWLLLVAATSTGVWAVISSAGEGVTTSRQVVPRPVPQPTSPRDTTAPPSSPATPRSPSATTAPSEPAEPTRPVRPTLDPSSRDVDPTPRPRPDGEVRRTWDSAAGSVVVACHGGTIAFRGAQANSGWSVDVRERGPEEVDVEFESSGEADDVRVEASCVDGDPRFSD